MKKISREEQMMKNGGARVRAICWTCKNDFGDKVVWGNTAWGLTKKSARKNAVDGLTKHSSDEKTTHDIGYFYL